MTKFFSFICRLLIKKLHYFSLVVFCVIFKAKKKSMWINSLCFLKKITRKYRI